jgi:assimilatory nitrate reductase catalytic subunit
MGFGAAFDYAGPAAIFREHAALSAFENNGTRDFDLGSLAGLSDADYDVLVPLHWPAPIGGAGGTKRMFADGRFFTPSGRARFIAVEDPVLAEPPDADFPLCLWCPVREGIVNAGELGDDIGNLAAAFACARALGNLKIPIIGGLNDHRRKLPGGFSRLGQNDATIFCDRPVAFRFAFLPP